MDAPTLKRIWITPLLFAGLVAVFGWWCDTRLRQTIESQLAAKLAATIEANVTALEIWMTNQVTLATALATEPRLRELALQTLARAETNSPPTTNTNNTSSLDAPAPRRGRPAPEVEELATHLRSRLEHVGYGMAHLVGTNLNVVGGTMRLRGRGNLTVHEDHVARYTQLFANAAPVIITPFKPGRPPGFGPGPGPGAGPGPDAGPRPDDRGTPGFGPEFGPGQRLNPGRNNTTRAGLADRRRASSDPDRPPDDGPSPEDRGAPADGARFRRGDLTLMQVAAPILDDAGTVRGALALIINPDNEFSRILSVARSGKSGETYAFDQRGLLISRSRFDDQLRALGLIEDRAGASSALSLRLSDPGSERPKSIAPEDPDAPTRPLTLIVSNAVAGGWGLDTRPALDYRGVPVVGAWRWLPHRGFGVATQIDATEAYQPLRVLKFLFLILFLLLLLCGVGLLLFSFANVASRRRLTEIQLRLKQLGQYTLEERIGEGGMGVVYRARHALLRRETAVKLLLPDRADPETIRRFEREVCLTCRLTHPNTIQIFDYGRTPDGIFYYAMEYLRGLNLQDLVRRTGPLPEARVVHILTHVCEALTEAHAAGLVHRDIKPANVILCERGGLPDYVKVLDFGLVREIHEPDHGAPSDPRTTTSATTITGTPSYMPPESMRNPLSSDPRSDLYSVGALGYFLITGERVFEAENFLGLYERHLTSTPIPPSARSTNPISAELERVLLRCLAKDPADRPQSAEELRARLAATPFAHTWKIAERTAWWTRYAARKEPGSQPGAASASPATPVPGHIPTDEAALAIDLTARQDENTVRTPAPPLAS